MTNNWYYEIDFSVFGTGVTAISGGGLWLPGDPLMRNYGGHDLLEVVVNYMEATIGKI